MYDNSHDKKILQCLTCSLIISLPFILQKIKKNPFTSYCDNIMATVVTTIKSAKEVLASLRKEPFCIECVEKLVNHRVVQVSKAGTLPLKVMAAFLCEQYYVVSADIRSMEHLVSRCEDSDVIGQYFSFFYNGQTGSQKTPHHGKSDGTFRIGSGELRAPSQCTGLSFVFLLLSSLWRNPSDCGSYCSQFSHFWSNVFKS